MTNAYQVNTKNGLLEPVLYQLSPHHDERPDGVTIDMVVVHGISLPPGQFGTNAVEAFFCGKLDSATHPAFEPIKEMKVSAHLFIKRTGEIIQFVPFSKRAWHAGESSFQGKTRCNDFSIGIELEGTDDILYEQKQYEQLARVLSSLIKAYPAITHDRIVGHVDIAPGRKTDPGSAFDWAYLRGMIA